MNKKHCVVLPITGSCCTRRPQKGVGMVMVYGQQGECLLQSRASSVAAAGEGTGLQGSNLRCLTAAVTPQFAMFIPAHACCHHSMLFAGDCQPARQTHTVLTRGFCKLSLGGLPGGLHMHVEFPVLSMPDAQLAVTVVETTVHLRPGCALQCSNHCYPLTLTVCDDADAACSCTAAAVLQVTILCIGGLAACLWPPCPTALGRGI